MDVLTHGFLPYAVMTWLRQPKSHRALAALGGIAPDLDTFFSWLSHAHTHAYPLVHRGFSHTLWGAPLMAVLALFLLSRPRLHKKWPRLAVFAWRPQSIAPLWIGAWSHLLLDGLTITGVPILWPFETTRFTLNWFFYGIFYLLPFSLYALIQIARGRARDGTVRKISIVVLALMLTAGGIRYESQPKDLEPGSHLTPGPNEWTWYVSYRNESGTLVYAAGLTQTQRLIEFFPDHNRTEAAIALERCQGAPQYIAVEWDAWAPLVVNATLLVGGGWRIEFYDPVQLYAQLHPPPSLARSRLTDDETKPAATCTVTQDGEVDFDRERGWFGS